MRFFIIKKKKIAGFLLVETLVAISLLLMVVPSTLDSVAKGLSNSAYAKNEMIATYLAQEGMEVIRLARDENMLAKNPWLTGIGSAKCGTAVGGCVVDPVDAWSIATYNAATAPDVLYTNTNNASNTYGSYSHDNALAGTWTKTVFSRRVYVDSVTSTSDEVKITSTVSFLTSYGPRSVSVSENVYNWLQ